MKEIVRRLGRKFSHMPQVTEVSEKTAAAGVAEPREPTGGRDASGLSSRGVVLHARHLRVGL